MSTMDDTAERDSRRPGRRGLRRRVPAAVIGALLLTAAGVAHAAVYEGTGGNDSVTVDRGGSVAYLHGGEDTFEGAQGFPSDPGDDWGGVDHVFAGSGNDQVSSHTYDDMLHGGSGEDTMNGGAGRDGVYGGPGNDTLTGGAGVDLFKPRGGTDTCIGQRKDHRLSHCEFVQLIGD